MRNLTLAVMLMASLEALACKIERVRSETHLALDPLFSKSVLMSKADLSALDVTGCDGSIPYLMVGSSVTFHQTDASKRETLLADVDPSKNNCRIEFPAELSSHMNSKQISDETVLGTIKSRKYFIDTCLQYEVSEFSGKRLEFETSQNCQVSEEKSADENGSLTYTLRGQTCLVKVSKNTNLKIKTLLSSACLGAELLRDEKIKAQDIETQFNVWPAMIHKDGDVQKLQFDQPLSSGPVRYTIVPSRMNILQQKALQRVDGQPSFVQVSGIDADFAKLDVTMIGAEKYAVQPTFYISNNANQYCDVNGINCISPSEYSAPMAANMELFEVAEKRNYKASMGRWLQAVKIPARFAGFAEVRPDNNLGGTQAGALVLDQKLEKGKIYLITAEFSEPKSLMDNDNRLKQLFAGDVSMPKLDRKLEDGALPALPSLGINTGLQPFAPIQSTKLDQPGFEFFANRKNMKMNWSHYLDIACNSQSQKCQSIAASQPFIKIEARLTVTEDGRIKILSTKKTSALFGSYNVDLRNSAQDGMMKKVCK